MRRSHPSFVVTGHVKMQLALAVLHCILVATANVFAEEIVCNGIRVTGKSTIVKNELAHIIECRDRWNQWNLVFVRQLSESISVIVYSQVSTATCTCIFSCTVTFTSPNASFGIAFLFQEFFTDTGDQLQFCSKAGTCEKLLVVLALRLMIQGNVR